MSDIEKFLRYLQREDVRELVLQSDKVAALRLQEGMHGLTQEPLTTGQLVALLGSCGLASYLPTGDSTGKPGSVGIGTGRYDILVARKGDLLKIRFARAGTWVSPPSSRRSARIPLQSVRVPDSPPAVTLPPKQDTSSVPSMSPSVRHQESSPARVKVPPGAPVPEAIALGPGPSPNVAQPRLSKGRTRSVGNFPEDPPPPPAALLKLLQSARQRGASDVHISTDNEVRFREVGRLQPQGAVLGRAEVDAMLLPILDDRRKKLLAELGYADLALQVASVGRLRVNVNRQRTGLKGCFRLIPEQPATIDGIGLPHEVRKLSNYHQGLAIVSGPNGQGKTTTMSALVNMLNEERAFHIITVEDPVEFVHPIKKAVLSQRQVHDHTNSFQSALKGALREDPDIIIIGELRDKETVAMALSAAETGHLVIATMSTPNGAKTIDRLIDMFPPDDQAQVRATLAGALKLIVSQRLVPAADGTRLFAASELITGGIALWNLIRDNKLFQLPSLQQRGRNMGMIRIEDSLSDLLEKGLITDETARYYANDARALRLPSAAAAASAPAAAPQGTPEKRNSFFSRKG